MTIRGDADVAPKPKSNVNNFSVLMGGNNNDEDDDKGLDVSHIKGFEGGSSSNKMSFAASASSTITGDDGASWQTKTKPVVKGKEDGMYRGSSAGIRKPMAPRPPVTSTGAATPNPTIRPRNPNQKFSNNLPMLPERTLELYDFPAALRTEHLHAFLHSVEGTEGHYRLKWQNDTSCFVICDSSDLLHKLLSQLPILEQDSDKQINMRPFSQENVIAKPAAATE